MKFLKTFLCIILMLVVCASSAFAQTEKLASTIRLRLPMGASFVQTIETHSDIIQSIGGMENSIKQSNQMEIRWDVKDVDDRGNMKIDLTYERIQVKMDDPMSGEAIHFDSNTSTTSNPMTAGYEVLIGKTLSMTMSPTGGLSNLSGWQSIQEEMISGMGEVPEAMKEMMKAQLSEEALFGSFESLSGPYGSGPVSINDSWTTKDEISMMGIELVGNTTFRLSDVTESEYILDLSGTISSQPGGSKTVIMGMPMTIECSGPQSGKMGLDRKTGFILRGTIENDLKQKINMGEMGSIDQVVKSKILFNIK